MKHKNSFLAGFQLFHGIDECEIERFLADACCFYRDYVKNSVIICEGDTCHEMGVICEGEAIGEAFTSDGRRNSFIRLTKGCVFGSIIAMGENKKSPVTVKTVCQSKILFIPFNSFTNDSCPHGTVLKNLSRIISQKYFALSDRANCLSQPSIRGKIICYLHRESVEKGSNTFELTLSRSELADYLAVDRSALSREMSKMQSEGLIEYKLKHISLKDGGNFQ